MNGVIAALMAQRGLTGIKTSFEGPAGLFQLYFQGKYDRDYLIGNLGQRFEGVSVSLKPWSANRIIHAHIQAALEIVRAHSIAVADIDQITLYVMETQKKYAGDSVKKPSTGTEARISLPFCVGSAIANNGLSLRSFTADGLSDKTALALAQKIVAEDISYVDVRSFFPPGKVAIKLKSGRSYSSQIDHAPGHPGNPMSFADVSAKFSDCAAYSRSPVNAEKIIGMVGKLEALDDIRTLLGLF
jgi:2-methylcitrate dehydratase PrpD